MQSPTRSITSPVPSTPQLARRRAETIVFTRGGARIRGRKKKMTGGIQPASEAPLRMRLRCDGRTSYRQLCCRRPPNTLISARGLSNSESNSDLGTAPSPRAFFPECFSGVLAGFFFFRVWGVEKAWTPGDCHQLEPVNGDLDTGHF